MKVIKYRICANVGDELVLSQVSLGYSETNLAIAKAEAYEGKYTIEDDGTPAPAPTTSDRLAALEVAMLELAGVTIDG